MPENMMAVVLDRFGPASVLEYREVPVARAGDDDAVVQVHAVSVNRTLDLRVRANGDGRRVTLPLVLGVDPSGVVVEIGKNVHQVACGDRVAVLPIRCGRCPSCRARSSCEERCQPGVERWGGYAQYVTVPAWTLIGLPRELDFYAATVMLRHYPVAHNLLVSVARLERDEWVLVLGSTGGLGSAGVQIAKYLGAQVIAGAGADERVDAAIARGADWGINYRSHDLEEEVAKITSGRGVAVLFENIADPTLWPSAFRCLGTGGRVVTAGAHGGGVVPLDVRRLYHRRLSILGSGGRSEDDVHWVLETARTGVLDPLVGAVLPLSMAQRAHEMVEANEVVGKVLLDPRLDSKESNSVG